MRNFRWTKAIAMFVPELDEEHRTIFRTAGELQQAILEGAALVQVEEILHRLIAHAEEHFAHEERLMRSFHYPIFEWHRLQHETVRKRLKHFVPLIENGDQDAPTLLVEFLHQWLTNHLGLADRMMGAFLRNQQRLHAA
jgi:hemerythrin